MLLIYRTITNVLYPILIIIVYLRKIIGKEDATRFKEKIFTSYFDVRKNEKRELIWLHVASIGELLSVINLIKELERSEKNFEFLVTTVTLSSGRIAEKVFKGKKNITHRYFPLDCNHLINNFLDRWKPMLVLFVDSEIWPNFLFAIKKRGIDCRPYVEMAAYKYNRDRAAWDTMYRAVDALGAPKKTNQSTYSSGTTSNGFTKVCYYNGMNGPSALTVSSLAICPLSHSHSVTGMTKVCNYPNGLGGPKAITISTMRNCPLTYPRYF